MKLDFEKWLDEKYENKLLSHIESNSEAIKNIFEESIICYKSGAYRASIVMAMTGFNMIMRDRLLKYKDSLESLDKSIHFESNNLIDDNAWDRALGNFIISNKKNFDKIFPNKSNWNNSWIHYRDMRNISAHGKEFRLHYSDVESLYSWITQAFDTLYPITALETLIEDINIFFDISKTPENKSYDYIINNSLYISSEEELDKIFICLYKIYITNMNNNKLRLKVIDLLSKMFEIKKNVFVNVIKKFIKNYLHDNKIQIEDENTKSFHYSEFLKELLYYHTNISIEIDYDTKYYFVKNGFFAITDYNKLYEKRIIEKELILDKLKEDNFYYLNIIEKEDVKYIQEIIDIEIKRRCELLRLSTSFNNSREIISKIPKSFLNKEHADIIMEAYKNNDQVYRLHQTSLIDYIKKMFYTDEDPILFDDEEPF
ncbi:ankryin [Brachyspira pilosicoli]|uniref:ankryin n=1 Tax=Brachyspira pilosicoli TaxID=52584 RepID=UPI0030062862